MRNKKLRGNAPTIDLPRMSVLVELACVCGNWWQSEVLALWNDGPVYKDLFCASCGRKGTRREVTSASIDGLLSDDEIDHIHQIAIHTFLYLITQMFNPCDVSPGGQLRPRLSYASIGAHTAETTGQVRANIGRLVRLGWLKAEQVVAGSDEDHDLYEFEFGTPWEQVMERQQVKHG